MRNLKRVLSLALALVMVLGMMVITTSAADFTDAESIKYEEAVGVMSTLGILKGYPDGSFKPAGTLTRAEAAKILAFVMLGEEADNYLSGSGAVFTDVAATSWAAKYVAYCKNVGVINGVNAEQTVFNPAGTLTVVQFAKMLLAAIEAEGTFTGPGWEQNVKNAFNAIPALKATGIKVTNAVITREEAAELALAAMKVGEAYSNGWFIKGYEKVGSFGSYAAALTFAKSTLALDLDKVVIEEKTGTRNSLLEASYGVDYVAADVDEYGRPGVGYEKTVAGKKVIDLFFVEDALAFEGYLDGTDGVYAVNEALEAAGVKLVYEVNKDHPQNGAFKVDDEGKPVIITVDYVKDGKPSTTELETTYSITELTKSMYDVALEIYVSNGAISKIVVIETHAAIAEFVKATKTEKAYIMVEGLKYETEDYKSGDVVLYTKYWNAGSYKVDEIVDVAEPFVGKLTSYTNKNVFTINGETYTISYGSAEEFNPLRSEIQDQLGKDYVYHLGANGGILSANPVVDPEVDEVEIADYAWIRDIDVAYTMGGAGSTDKWGNAVEGDPTEVIGVAAKAEVIFADGTTGIYSLTVEEEDGVYSTVIGKDEKNKDIAVVLYDGKNVATEAAADAILDGYVNEIWAYTLTDGALALVEEKAPVKAADKLTASTLELGDILVNEDTVVVVRKDVMKNGKLVGYTYETMAVADLEASELTAYVFYKEIKDSNDKLVANVATLIFAVEESFKATSPEEVVPDLSNVIYITSSYTVTKANIDKDEELETVYNYVGVKVDGTEVDVWSTGTKSAGVYMYDADNKIINLDQTVATKASSTVSAIVGSTCKLASGKTFVLTDKIEVIAIANGAELEVGAKITYVSTLKDGIVAIYVTKAAE